MDWSHMHVTGPLCASVGSSCAIESGTDDGPVGRLIVSRGPCGRSAFRGGSASASRGGAEEVRTAFRDILARAEASGLLFDQVKIAYTDTERYLPLLQAAADRHGLPITVSVGTPLDHTRPGQALRAWLEEHRSQYGPQLRAHATAWAKQTGIRVRRAGLWFTDSGGTFATIDHTDIPW